MKTGLIAFHFPYLQLLHVKRQEAIVHYMGLYVRQDFLGFRILGAIPPWYAAGTWATPDAITSTTEIHESN